MQEPLIGDPANGTGPRPSSRSRARRFIAALGLVALIGAAAYVSTLPMGATPPAWRAPAAVVDATVRAGEGVGIGQSAPDFVSADDARRPLLVDLDQRPIRLADFADRPLWIVFWATWCAPCQQEASGIRAAYHAHRGDDLAVLAIDVQEPAAAVREYALVHDLDYAIGLDPTAAVKAMYDAWGLPSHIFLDRDGVVRDHYFGQLTDDLMEQHLGAIIGS